MAIAQKSTLWSIEDLEETGSCNTGHNSTHSGQLAQDIGSIVNNDDSVTNKIDLRVNTSLEYFADNDGLANGLIA